MEELIRIRGFRGSSDTLQHASNDPGTLMIRSLVTLVLACVHMNGVAQPDVKPLVFGEVRSLHSAAMGQERTLNILLPTGYTANDSTRYPVIYLLDGSANEDYPHLAGLVQFMNTYELLPKSIVVGIANVDRYHDFTHATKGDSDLVWLPTGGGSAAFIEFLADELVPFIDLHYRSSGKRTLVGQSLGGLLATEVLLKKPGLFDRFALVSPSLWWDNGSLAQMAADRVKTHGTSSSQVFIATAKDDDWSQPGVDALVAAFKTSANPPFRWTLEVFPNETHATILHRAAYRAFEWFGEGR